MSRYTKIESRVWCDRKVASLSRLKPSGQALWLYLLTYPHSGQVPGLFMAGEAGMAEELGWGIDEFRGCLDEIAGVGMVVVDFSVRVVWIPGMSKYNKPRSPNVVRSWKTDLKQIPDCPIKTEAVEHLHKLMRLAGKPFEKAFLEVVDGIGAEKHLGRPCFTGGC